MVWVDSQRQPEAVAVFPQRRTIGVSYRRLSSTALGSFGGPMRRRQLLQSTSLLAAATGAPFALRAAALHADQFRVVPLQKLPTLERSRLDIAHASGSPSSAEGNVVRWAQVDLIGSDGRELRLWRMTRHPVLNRGREVSLPLSDSAAVQIRLRFGLADNRTSVTEQYLRLARGDSVALIGPGTVQSIAPAEGQRCYVGANAEQAFCEMLAAVEAETLWLRLS